MRARTSFAVAAVLAASVLTGCAGQNPAAPAARGFLTDWSNGLLRAAAARTDQPAAALAGMRSLANALGVVSVRAQLISVDGTTASTQVTLRIAGLGDWRYDGTLQLTDQKVHWSLADLVPGWTTRRHLAITRTLPPRAPIEDAAGAPLFKPTAVVVVGVEPARLGPQSLPTLARVLGLDETADAALVKSTPPTQFVPLITLRRPAYEAVKPQIYSLPGVFFQAGTMQLAPTRMFAAALLGRIGPATAQLLKAAGSAYLPGDELGLWGLQAYYQQRLAGTASGEVDLVARSGRTVKVLHRFVGHSGKPVRVTIDPRLQQAADAAVASAGRQAILVAVQASTGDVLADAETPLSAEDFAFAGTYPPGSTFKVVSTYALLGRGVTATLPTPCPPSVTIDGRTFHNFEGEATGPVPFSRDFAISCNGAFMDLASRLRSGDLPAAARAFGLGLPWTAPPGAFTGSVPTPTDYLNTAVQTIGQGQDLVSPLDLALVAAAVDAGTWRPPIVVLDPEPRQPVGPRALDPARVAALRQLMRLVVTSGTGTAANLPGVPVYGKTGTAEYGSGNPPPTDAWFIGFRGDLAFAVLVPGGGVGGAVAAPIAARFLRAVG
jgi:cell division protein FtsI/penicillin-binding protein 2